jgi:cyanophycinase-like exopeptidase
VSSLAIGLLGSGEFEPWAEAVDRWLLERASGGDGTVLILPTASAPEGDQVFDNWAEMGLAHYGRQGIKAEIVALKTPADANRPDLVARLERASMVFFSGGNPAYLASTLAGSAFWDALVAAMARGLAYAGCSAGVACLGERAPDSSFRELTAAVWQPGLRLFPGVYFGPHWDMLDTYIPGLQEFFRASVPAGGRLLAIDERTAIVGDGRRWSAVGASAVHLWEGGDWREFQAGQSFEAELAPDQAPRPPGS